MRYGTVIPITVRGHSESHIFEFHYQILNVSVKRIVLVREVWEILTGGEVRAEWFRHCCPQSLWDELEAEMLLHADKATGLTVTKACKDEAAEALRRVC